MKNAYFNEKDLSIILSGAKLSLISSTVSDINPVNPDKRYLEWINNNSHSHHHRELMLVLSGGGCFTLNGSTYPYQPGTFFLIDSDEAHDFYYPSFYDNFRHLWFRVVNKTIFTSSPYSKINGNLQSRKNFNYTFSDYSHSGHLFISAWNELSCNKNIDSKFKGLCLKHTFAGLLLELCKAGYDVKMNEAPTEFRHRTVINAIVEHIRETGGKSLDIARLAYIAGYSKFHFARIFKSITGYSVLEFINLSRMDKYKELSAAGLNKKQISSKLGFSCPASFSRWLKDANSKRK